MSAARTLNLELVLILIKKICGMGERDGADDKFVILVVKLVPRSGH